jgi:hypothetical protein
MYTCEFCKKDFKSISSLNYHVKTAKYCLEIQNKVNITFQCSKCKKILSCKKTLENHILKCVDHIDEFKNKIILLEKEIEIITCEYKNNILKMETLLNEKQVQIMEKDIKIDALEERLERIASKPTTTTTNNTTTNNDNRIQITYQPIELNEKLIEDNIHKYIDDYIIDGITGVANYVADEVIPSEFSVNGYLYRYTCTDSARKICKYKDINGNIIKDKNCSKMLQITQPVIKKALIDRTNILTTELSELTPEIIAQNKFKKDLYHFKLDKISEVQSEVTDMHLNNKFSNALINRITI